MDSATNPRNSALTGSGKAAYVVLPVAAGATGLFLFAGLWTPLAGVLVAVLELWIAFSTSGESWPYMLAAAIALALAFVGPGAWSIAALAYEQKRIF